MVGRFFRFERATEDYRRNTVDFEASSCGEIRFSTPEFIGARGWSVTKLRKFCYDLRNGLFALMKSLPVSCVIIHYSAACTSGRTNDNVSAIHGIEIVFRCVLANGFWKLSKVVLVSQRVLIINLWITEARRTINSSPYATIVVNFVISHLRNFCSKFSLDFSTSFRLNEHKILKTLHLTDILLSYTKTIR